MSSRQRITPALATNGGESICCGSAREGMSDLRIYIPKALAFQRVAKSAIAAATQVDHGIEMNDAHAFALLEFFEFLAPEQITPHMGPGFAAELSAIVEKRIRLGFVRRPNSCPEPPLHPCVVFRGAVLL